MPPSSFRHPVHQPLIPIPPSERGGTASASASASAYTPASAPDPSRHLLPSGDRPYQDYELDDIVPDPVQSKHQQRVEAKRDAKRRWLDEQDDMKFSHSIQFNAVPDWSSHYIAYSNLKKL